MGSKSLAIIINLSFPFVSFLKTVFQSTIPERFETVWKAPLTSGFNSCKYSQVTSALLLDASIEERKKFEANDGKKHTNTGMEIDLVDPYKEEGEETERRNGEEAWGDYVAMGTQIGVDGTRVEIGGVQPSNLLDY